MDVDHSLVRAGLSVVTSDDQDLGIVKEVRESDFLVAREMERDVYVPFPAIQAIRDPVESEHGPGAEQIVLTIPADEIDNMGWASPPLGG
jgi:hypothetical protein